MEQIKKVGPGMFEIDINDTVTVSFKLEEEFLAKIDEKVKNMGYLSRSELIRDAILSYVNHLNSLGRKNDGNT
ncbi:MULTISPECIES: ribbon-helix-helix domain-containing protein [Acidianus]|uniref:CopG family transcriptional regulator n=1 Tax=Candidatus Acidianus copahuensis TaxID=1160895 RepID=A0A031LTQ6_9CREN|nr:MULTISPECIES: ribbon-helix-helix domain-containing protein [Acidianus]EZQ11110.1 CopG family transcriptional regulator [Candidatus Acidianus copahuensis]NON62653.1 CopG family transcriptional regulator [Acidianus sp. RZ1]